MMRIEPLEPRLALGAAPVAVDDFYEVETDGILLDLTGVLANDFDPDGQTLILCDVVEWPAAGRLAVLPNGAFAYAPDRGFTGVDRFQYTVTDHADGDAVATVELRVGNRPPAAGDDQYQVEQDTPLLVWGPGLLANDSDPDGDELVAELVEGPGHGQVVLGRDGFVCYLADWGFCGMDGFTYEVRDPAGLSDTGTVRIDVGRVEAVDLVMAAGLFADDEGRIADPIGGPVAVGDEFWVAIDLEDTRPEPSGVIGLGVDLFWDAAILEVVEDSAWVTPQLPLFQTSGRPDQEAGRYLDLGGGALPAGGLGQAVGDEGPERFAALKFRAIGEGQTEIQIGLGHLGFAFADAGELTEWLAVPAAIEVRPV